MNRILTLLAVGVCLAGCQTTETGRAQNAMKTAMRNEKLLLRVNQLIGTYEVRVERAALEGTDPKQKDQWAIIGSAGVEGYPGKFRASDGTEEKDGVMQETFLLDGTPVKVALEPGTHLVAKVIPELQNTARVVGVYVQVPDSGGVFSMPFDLVCDMGRVYEVYDCSVPTAVTAKVNSSNTDTPLD
ncbi:hypothetical protein EGM51_12255 [Verrucomicrobia bacterium S94]|nr:hypothetical protein EGM51_12255 [Verrucomicrobia bacterium S94]